jgi:hypothetical protein
MNIRINLHFINPNLRSGLKLKFPDHTIPGCLSFVRYAVCPFTNGDYLGIINSESNGMRASAFNEIRDIELL